MLREKRVCDLHVTYRKAGHGPPLALLHGGLEDSRAWDGQLHGLSDAFTVVAWDTPGCGSSEDPPESWRMADYADCAAALLAEVVHGPAHVLGLSWGSTLALELYRRHPGAVSSLILTAPYAGWAGSLPPEEVESRLRSTLAQLERPPREWAHEWLPGLLTERAPESLRHDLLRIMHDVRAPGSRPMIHAMAEADLRPVLAAVRVPTLVLVGELDVRSPIPVAQAIADAIPGARLEVLRDLGHQAAMEDPDAFNAAVRRFLGA